MDNPGTTVRQLWPLLFVSDIEHSTDFYCDKLGFDLVGKAEGDEGMFWCRIERGGACLMLQESSDGGPAVGAPGRGVAFYFVCDDVDAVYAEFLSRGLDLEPPSTAFYGMKQLFIPEPDGYAICFESPREGWEG